MNTGGWIPYCSPTWQDLAARMIRALSPAGTRLCQGGTECDYGWGAAHPHPERWGLQEGCLRRLRSKGGTSGNSLEWPQSAFASLTSTLWLVSLKLLLPLLVNSVASTSSESPGSSPRGDLLLNPQIKSQSGRQRERKDGCFSSLFFPGYTTA